VFALLLFLQSGSEIVLAGYTTTYVMETLHAPVTTANWLLTSLWISVMLARLVLARILPGASGHTVLIGSALCSAAGAAAFLLAQSLEAALAGMLLTGAGMAGIFPTLMGMAGARFQANSGTAFGVLLTAGRFGAMLVPFMVGHAAAWVGLSWSLSAVIWSSLLIAAIQWRRGEELEPI
jgi:FHS family glucose/mannose:H+ symporter-like MFS transporter